MRGIYNKYIAPCVYSQAGRGRLAPSSPAAPLARLWPFAWMISRVFASLARSSPQSRQQKKRDNLVLTNTTTEDKIAELPSNVAAMCNIATHQTPYNSPL